MSKITRKQLEEFILITDGGFGEIYDSTDGKGHYNRQKSSAWAGDVKEYLSKSEKFNFISYDVDDFLEILEIHEDIETIQDLEDHLHDHTECSFEDLEAEIKDQADYDNLQELRANYRYAFGALYETIAPRFGLPSDGYLDWDWGIDEHLNWDEDTLLNNTHCYLEEIVMEGVEAELMEG